MATRLGRESSPSDVIESIGQFARNAVAGDDSGILLVKAKGRVETPVGTSTKVNKAHDLQAELDEGPCVDALRPGGATALVTGNIPRDERWPAWGPRCAELGYLSVLSVRLGSDVDRLGSLNVYAGRQGAFTSSDVDVIELLAAHASVALIAAKKLESLNGALDSRNLIGQAQGVLMGKYDLDPDLAFNYLRRVSQDRNIKLVQVAQMVVDVRGAVETDSD